MNNKRSRCSGKTKAGKPCRAAATAGGLCFFHANPKKAIELGRIGGRRKGRTSDPTGVLLASLDSIPAVQEVLPRLISGVISGEIHPRVASALAPLLTLQLRVQESAFEQRVRALEEAMAKSHQEPPQLEAGADA